MCDRSSPAPLCPGDPGSRRRSRADRSRHGAPGLLAQIITAKYADHCPLYSAAGDLPTLRRRSRPGDAGGLGRPRAQLLERWSMPSAATCARRRRSTPTTPGASGSIPDAARPRPGDYGPTSATIARREPRSPACWYRYSPDPQERASARAPAPLSRHPASGRLQRLCSTLRRWGDCGGGVLGARAAQVL